MALHDVPATLHVGAGTVAIGAPTLHVARGHVERVAATVTGRAANLGGRCANLHRRRGTLESPGGLSARRSSLTLMPPMGVGEGLTNGSFTMADKFIPDSDRAFDKMAAKFAIAIAKDPARFKLSGDDAAEISRAADAF